MKRLAGALGFLCVVLLLLAFDERQTTQAVDAVRAQAGPLIARAETLIRNVARPSRTAPAAGAYPVLFGRFAPRGEAPTGAVEFVAAELRFETGGALRTRPHRIAYGRDAFAAPLRLSPDAQVEVREVVPMTGQRTVVPSPLCGGAAPGWLALAQRDGRVEVMLFRAGPAPTTATPAPLCGHWTYVKR